MTVTEGVLDALLSTLQDKLHDVGSSYGIGLLFFAFGLPSLSRTIHMPLVAVDVDEEDAVQTALASPAPQHRLIPASIYVLVSGRDTESLFRQLLRLSDVVVEVIRQNPTLSGSVMLAQATDISFSPAIEVRSEFIRASSIRVLIRVAVT